MIASPEIDALVSQAMSDRGFHRLPDRPGHWRSKSGFGHDLEFRHRTLVQWAQEAFDEGGTEAAIKKLRGKIDFLIERQVS